MSLTLTRRHNVDRFGYLIPTKYGNVPMVGAVATYRPGDGRFGGAVAVEEGTTNLFSHPNDLSHSSWGRQGLASVTQVEPPPGLATAWRLVEDNQLSLHHLRDSATFEEGKTYTYSVYARGGGGRNLTIQGYIALGSPIARFDLDKGEVFYQSGAVGRIEPVGNGWYRCSMTFTMNEPTVSSVVYFGLIQGRPTHLEASRYQGDGESYLDLSSPQKELKPFATSFVAGTRAGGVLTYPSSVVPANQGTVSLWVLFPQQFDGAIGGWARIFTNGNQSTVPGFLSLNGFRHNLSEANILRFMMRDDAGNAYLINTDKPLAGWHHVAITWNANEMALYVDGEKKASRTVHTVPSAHPFDWIAIGARADNYDHINTLLDELLILPYAASEEEIRAWYEATGPLPPHPQATLQWDWQAVRPATMVAL